MDRLQKKVADIESAQAAQLERTTTVESRLSAVETGVSDMRTAIQSNFDRLFDRFESMNTGSPSRKNARSAASPGSHGGTHVNLAKSIRYYAANVEEVAVDPSLFSLAFVNASTFRTHLDRLLELNVECACLAETNHTPQDMRSHKYVQRGPEWERVNLHWSPSVRQPKDQRMRGRASAGVLLASSLRWVAEDLVNTPLEQYATAGRITITKVHYSTTRFVWVATIYAHVLRDQANREANQGFLAALYTYLAPRSEEDIIIIGDFNIELSTDMATLQAMHTTAFVDVTDAIATDEVLPTYQCAAACSCIDRVVVSRSMWARIDSLCVIQDMAMGPHRPILVQFRRDSFFAHPRLNQVGEILQGSCPPSEDAIAKWQASKIADFVLFEQAVHEQDVDKLYLLWSSIWESYLLLDVPDNFDIKHCLGRAKAAVQFTQGETLRQGRAVLTDAERQLWRLKGLAQTLLQGRAVFEQRTWHRLRLLWASISARRTLTLPAQNDVAALPTLVDQITTAIKHERALAAASRTVKWKTAIHQDGGVNPLTRKILTGPGHPVHIVQHLGKDIVCPQHQADLLSQEWSAIGSDEPVTEVPAALLDRCRFKPLTLPRHSASAVRRQVFSMKMKAAHSLDWWRPSELRRLPWTAFAMLANLFNVAEDVGHLPQALQKGMIAAIAKDSSTVTPLQVRPICLLPVLHRIWSSCRYHDMSDWADAVTSPAQAAYKRGRSARGEAVKLIEHINSTCVRGGGGYLGQLDLSKAFPRLCHNKVATILLRMGAPPWLTRMLQDACLRKSLT
eukprot:5081485-Amphidinium_carterae.2